jgi:hypothetical protein
VCDEVRLEVGDGRAGRAELERVNVPFDAVRGRACQLEQPVARDERARVIATLDVNPLQVEQQPNGDRADANGLEARARLPRIIERLASEREETLTVERGTALNGSA